MAAIDPSVPAAGATGLPAEPDPIQILRRAVTPNSISYPEAQQLHLISDQEIDLLTKLADPMQAGVALTAAGVAATSIPGALPAIRSLLGLMPMAWDAGCWLVVLSITAAMAVICGWNAFHKRTDKDELVREIRRRKTIPLGDAPREAR